MTVFLLRDIWRYELRIIGPLLFVIPVGVVLFFTVLTIMMFVGNVPHSFITSLLIAGVEACLPLVSGIVLTTVVMQDAALELLLTFPVAYRAVMFARLLLVMGWMLLVDIIAVVMMYVFLPWVSPRPLLVGQLIWLGPSFWLAGVGILLALLLHSRTSSGAIQGCIWIMQLTFHGYFAQYVWLRPWFLFATLYTPDASFWLTNRLELIATGLVFLLAIWWFLRNPERRFFGEDA